VIAVPQALAIRRLLLVACALGATLVAHSASSADLALTRSAPLAWGSLGCLAILAGRRRRPAWRAWSPAGLVARLLVAEIALHLALEAAPWAFGVSAHHSDPVLAPRTLAAHAAAALLLALVLGAGQHALALAQRVVRAVRRALRVAAAGPLPRLRPPREAARPRLGPAGRSAGARGPPLIVS
jgi:hypothetical protein